MIGVAIPTSSLEARWTPTWTPSPPHRSQARRAAKAAPQLGPWRPAVGIQPKLSDAEFTTLAVMQALLGFTSEARWLRDAGRHLPHLFPSCPARAATTSVCAAQPTSCATSSGLWPATRRCGATTSRWWTPPRCARPVGAGAGADGGPAGPDAAGRQALLRPPVPADARRAGVRLLRPARKGETEHPAPSCSSRCG